MDMYNQKKENEKLPLYGSDDRMFLYLSLKNEGKTHEEAMIEVNKQMPLSQLGVGYSNK